jgi:hypothetical protein
MSTPTSTTLGDAVSERLLRERIVFLGQDPRRGTTASSTR